MALAALGISCRPLTSEAAQMVPPKPEVATVVAAEG